MTLKTLLRVSGLFWAGMLGSGMLWGEALAARPDTGAGLYAFESSDIIEYVDGPEGLVRVHVRIVPNPGRVSRTRCGSPS